MVVVGVVRGGGGSVGGGSVGGGGGVGVGVVGGGGGEAETTRRGEFVVTVLSRKKHPLPTYLPDYSPLVFFLSLWI